MITFKDTQLALIHIPLHLYRNFLQSILQLVLPNATRSGLKNASGAVQPLKGWPCEHPFVNISITPVECSIVCSRALAIELFVSVLNLLDPQSRESVNITTEDFVVMQVDGEGLDAGQRVLELTSPLALAGIPIFFITTYFSDYILVPLRHRSQVVQALEERGFQFEKDTSSYVNSFSHGRKHSATSLEVQPPSTPPPTTISELQTRTFSTLKRRNIVPTVDSSIRLVQCAGRRDNHSRNNSTTSADDALHLGLVKCLITQPYPKFLSLTLTDTESAALLFDHTLLPHFVQDTLLGSRDEFLTPITLDLRDLPMESTGIVCGVAGRLVGETTGQLKEPVEMSYLSTARAGTVMVAEEELERALDALRGASANGVATSNE
ncbi:ACT domain containing protein [Pyrenophora tritici-repentis]|uniref:ACT domain containing protein n=1 Tax=Pyrenophora tritici-repentis TaxID=45151 RepID=A0A922STX7_9PLEO|nr:ACT domain containing protein [Pyrenophora tritici-repentis]KAI1669060.1 ACT domain containing protein [Pyrenophora tritici-repentis]KAI1684272.1 ACT domain containing protein [Pyrenophora tritici-repentis]